MTFATEFPNFPADAMPPLPIGMRDSSWHNDLSPSYIGFGLQVFVEHPDPTAREIQGSARFIVSDDPEVEEDPASIFEAEEWSEVLRFVANHKRDTAAAIGLLFVWELQRDLSAEDFATMRALNSDECIPGTCHSHDFLDANMVMERAFRLQAAAGTGAVPLFGDNGRITEEAAGIWNAAWESATPYLRLGCREKGE